MRETIDEIEKIDMKEIFRQAEMDFEKIKQETGYIHDGTEE